MTEIPPLRIKQVTSDEYTELTILYSPEIKEAKVIFYIQLPERYMIENRMAILAQIGEAKRWCYTQVSSRVEIYKQYSDSWWIGFYDEEDAMLFKLRFSNG